MKKLILLIVLSLAVVGGNNTYSYPQPKIQIAVLLDTSSSMNGLIEQTKSRLWAIVNQVSDTRKHGIQPRVEVALYEYGKSSLPAYQGYMRMISPLTTDFDSVSENLFSLRTNGGSEYCGMVIEKASRELQWSRNRDDMKMIFIAGNEPFTQGSVHFSTGIALAKEKGIIVNTIYCGSYSEGVRGSWKNGAILAGGDYFSIDHNSDDVYISTPQDIRINELNRKLNNTYIPYGREGREKKARQSQQDRDAEEMSKSVIADRAVLKSKETYRNNSWDLGDAFKSGKADPSTISERELPAVMKNMSPQERKAYVIKKLREREKIQSEIKDLSKKREEYIKKRQRSIKQNNTFGRAVMKSIKKQAVQKGFKAE
jgi:hypothetical protein